MLSYYEKKATEEEFSLLDSPEDGCWIHAEQATVEDLEQICSMTGLELSDIQDSLDRYEVPRVEKVDHSVILYLRHPMHMESGLYTTTVTILLTTHYFITIAPVHSPLIQNLLTKKTKTSPKEKSQLLILVLLRITQEYNFQIRKVRHNVMTQQKEMIHVESDDISTLTKQEEILNQYLSSLVPLKSMLEHLLSAKFSSLYEQDREQIDDVLNTLKQSEDLATIVIKSIRSLRDSYQIIFTNNLNKTIKLLTALTILFSIPTMIASLYGMNVTLPFSGTPHMFPVLISIIAIFSFTCFYLFYRKRLL